MRGSLLLKTGLTGAAVVLGLAVGTPAWADSSVTINSGNVPATATGFGTRTCDPNQGGGPVAGADVWVFVLPGQHGVSGDFVSVSATFGAHGTVTITTAANPGNFRNGGPQTAKAWIVTPTGWTLTGASAVVTGTARFFNLTHTCPGSASPSPSTSTSPSHSASPSPSHSASQSASPYPSHSASPSASPSPSHSVSPSASPYPSATTVRPTPTSTATPGPYALASMVISGGGGAWAPGGLVVLAGGALGLIVALRRRRQS
jgi:hypothetical protein